MHSSGSPTMPAYLWELHFIRTDEGKWVERMLKGTEAETLKSSQINCAWCSSVISNCYAELPTLYRTQAPCRLRKESDISKIAQHWPSTLLMASYVASFGDPTVSQNSLWLWIPLLQALLLPPFLQLLQHSDRTGCTLADEMLLEMETYLWEKKMWLSFLSVFLTPVI